MTDPALAHTTDHGRMYSRTLGGTPEVPSITTVLGVEDAGGDLLRGWYGKQALIEAWGHPDTLDAVNGDQRARWRIEKACKTAGTRRSLESAARGDRIHDYAEQRARHTLGEVDDTTVKQARELLAEHGEIDWADSFDQWWGRWQVEPLLPEATVWNEEHRYAGTTDLYCRINGLLVLLDYKNKLVEPNSRFGPPTPKPPVVAQLHAAAHGTERHILDGDRWEPVSLRPQLLMAVMVSNKGVYPYRVADVSDPRPWRKFRNLRQLWQDQVDEAGGDIPMFRPVAPPPSAR